MMIIIPPDTIHMQRHPRRHRPAAQPMMDHLTIQLPNHRPLEPKIPHKKGATRDVKNGTGECFVEGRVGVAEADEPGAGAQGGGEGGAEGEEGVFGCVVVVDWGTGG